MYDKVKMEYKINSDLDLCIKITKNLSDDDETFFLLECGFTNMKIKNTKSYKDYMKSYLKNTLVKRMEYNMIGLKGYSKKNHVMNQKYIFF